ncbi:MAG: FAD-dependent oxidoreductase [Oligoflexales bacterium]
MQTSQQEKTYDVVIVGAGPTGLSLGLALAREKKRVIVLEKKSRLSERSKAPAIWPRTQEILQQLGVLESFLSEGTQRPRLEFWDADRDKVLVRLDFDVIKDRTSCPRLLVLEQAETERLLFEKLRTYPNAEILFDHEVGSVSDIGDSVFVQYASNGETSTVFGKYVVGCDGAHSVVRGALGFHLGGFTYPFQISLVDILIKNEDERHPLRMSTRGGLALGINIKGGLWRLILPFTDKRRLTVSEAVSKLFGTMEYEQVWFSDFHIHDRMSSNFVKGRIAIAGDAAHLNSPVGGQGMNAAIQDAYLLSKVLADALARNEPAHLRRYEAERRQIVRARVNRFTNLLTRLLLGNGGRWLRFVMQVAGLACRVRWVQRQILKKLAMLGKEARPRARA